jgi:hypothetical protein
MPTIRLVKVLVQPVFILDHGDRIEEVEHSAVTLPAEDWPEYSGRRFPAEVAEWQARLDAENAAEKPKQNRTTQGSKKA